MNSSTANKQIIFVDSSVQNYQNLIEGADANAKIVILDDQRSGIEQITQALASESGIEAVHVVSHGNQGSLKLGADVLNGNELENFNTQLKQWGNALTENGDILLYGCDAAAGETGNNFVKRLSELTGADVAASNDLTGNAVKGGDWDLEIVTGQIESAVPFNRQAMKDYDYTLATFNVTVATDTGDDTVANSLSWAIRQANVNPGADTIILDTDVTVTAVMKNLINSDISFSGNNRIVSGNNQFRPFFVKSGIVDFSNMTVTNSKAQGGSSYLGGGGAGMGGGLFIYGGSVTVNNVAFSNNKAVGGNGANKAFDAGGGGMFGNSDDSGGGGLFASSTGTAGAYGGNGNYGGGPGGFGGGGTTSFGDNGGTAGFGGGGGLGGGGFGGEGGFGGGGGFGGYGGGGFGGYGGGGGGGNFGDGVGGYGGGKGGGGGGVGGGGAGMGGAIFIRTGSLTLNNATFSSNTATGGTGKNKGQGLGGAIFAMQALKNTNGNHQGMPTALPTVTSLGATFTTNSAANQASLPAANTPANGVGSSQNNNDVYGTILGNTVNLSVSSNAGTEAGTTAITVTATASAAVVGNQTVNLGVTGTNITAGDYNLSGTTITIPSGQTTGTVTFTVADDALIEGSETGTLTISTPSAGLTLGTKTTQNIAITDNDFPAVNLSVTPTTGTEAGTTAITVTATASQAVVGNQTVNVALSGTALPADFTGIIPTSITIPSGQTTGTFTFTVADDALIEGSETATLTISNPSAGLTLGTNTTQNIAITDNDFPAVNLSVTPTAGTEAGTTAITVTATASQAVVGNQTVNVALSGTALPADFTGIIPT
ncbi:DUF4347 domain-containing protein, partial [Microcoleus sp. Z1_B2]|uniref:DUF4347 domain-containing protein n=1 Tax=Microcoleus sp. Z1_B2 TaxID=3055429 RepID=UPI002FD28066